MLLSRLVTALFVTGSFAITLWSLSELGWSRPAAAAHPGIVARATASIDPLIVLEPIIIHGFEEDAPEAPSPRARRRSAGQRRPVGVQTPAAHPSTREAAPISKHKGSVPLTSRPLLP